MRLWIGLGAVLALAWGAYAWGESGDLIGTRLPSRAVYPPHDYQVIFDHAFHSQQSPCPLCHRMVAMDEGVPAEPMPSMETCGSCHDQAADTEDPLACSHCHRDYRPMWPDDRGMTGVRDPRFPLVRPRPPVRLAANLHFEHGTHGRIPCVTCHPMEVEGGASLPLEELCLDCHRSSAVSDDCGTCHPSGDDGRLVTRFSGSRTASPQLLRPADHGLSFRQDHGGAVQAEPTACFRCHSEQSCLNCHVPSLGIRTIHPPGFIEDHGLDGRRAGRNCASCHQVTAFCVDCHVDAGYGDDTVHGPVSGYPYHPAGWQDLDGRHGRAAQRNLAECASCHQESHCAGCHQAVSPHGPAFGARCGTLRSANPSVCTRCHADEYMASLLDRCR
ncbi:MAG: hypothetical protein JW797_11135 [Bradymonadales bacterium]|nr:hypothetical protein [Bradymonadales bacterium]